MSSESGKASAPVDRVVRREAGSRIVDRMEHHHRYGALEDIPVLVDAVKSLISCVYGLPESVAAMEQRLRAAGHSNDNHIEGWFSPDLEKEFGGAPPAELLGYVEARRERQATPVWPR